MAKSKNPTPRTNKAEYERRVLIIQGWLVESVQYYLIIQEILKKEWCKSKRHAERMIASARDRWLDYEEDKMANKRRFKILQLENYKRSLDPKFKGTPQGIRALMDVEKTIIKLEAYDKGIQAEKEKEQDEQLRVLSSQSASQEPSEVDYSLLSDSALQEILKARVKKI